MMKTEQFEGEKHNFSLFSQPEIKNFNKVETIGAEKI